MNGVALLNRWKYSYKLAILRGAWQRGVRLLARQFWLISADAVWRRQHLVFRQDAAALAARTHTAPVGFTMREIGSLAELTEASRVRLAEADVASKWGAEDWFSLGWRLWIGEEDRRIAAFAWWRNAAESADFFVPVEPTQEVLWHVFVLPEYRGRNLHRILWAALAQNRVREGIAGFLTNCRDYNLPSRYNIETAGFVRIGACSENRYTGRRLWHPARVQEKQ